MGSSSFLFKDYLILLKLQMLRAIISDHSQEATQMMAELIKQHCNGVIIKAITYNVTETMRCIQKIKPDIIFLSADLPQLETSRLMEQVSQFSVKVVFTATNDAFAIKAIKYAPLDYLIKPFNPVEIKQVIEKALKAKNDKLFIGEQLGGLIRRFSQIPLPAQQQQPKFKDRIT
jgi:two-component system, LytTR family, response regulator